MMGLLGLGYQFTLRCDRLDAVDAQRIRVLLAERERAPLQGLDICPRTCPSLGAQSCTYVRWFARPDRLPNAKPRSFATLRLPASLVKAVLRFRTSCHGLPVDIGRRQRVPRLQRVCQKCDGAVLGDERHLIFECQALDQLRAQYAHLFYAQTMLAFMCKEDVVSVARFIREALSILPFDAAVDAASDNSSNQP